jgi:integrase
MWGTCARRGTDWFFLSRVRVKRKPGSRLSLSALREIVKNYFRAANISGGYKTTHSLRHTAITNAIRNGALPMAVQAMARHKSFDTTLGYYHEVGRLDNPAEDLIEYQ